MARILSQVTRNVWRQNKDFFEAGSNAPTLVTRQSHKLLDFADAASGSEESIFFEFHTPFDLNSGIFVRLALLDDGGGGGSGDVQFIINSVINGNAPTSPPSALVVTVPDDGTTFQFGAFEFTSDNFSGGEALGIEVVRDSANANDTYGSAVGLEAIELDGTVTPA